MARLAADVRGNTRRTVTADGTLWLELRMGNRVLLTIEAYQTNDNTVDVYKHEGPNVSDRTGVYIGRYKVNDKGNA